jgi:integrase
LATDTQTFHFWAQRPKQCLATISVDVSMLHLPSRRLMGESERGLTVKNEKIFYRDLRTALIDDYVARGNKSLEQRADGTETIVGLPQLDRFCGYEPDKRGQPGSGNPGLPVHRLTTDLARAFVKKRAAEKAGQAMINRSLQCLRRMLRIAHEDGKIETVPKIRLLKEPGPRKGFLERADFEALLKVLPTHLRPLIAFLYWTGVRKGEALAIEWEQVDFDAGLITLHDDQTKNNEPRVIPLPNEVQAMLRDIEPKVGKVSDGANLRAEWEAACAAVGLGERTLNEVEHERLDRKEPRLVRHRWHEYRGRLIHDLRRSAVRNLRLAGVPENVAMKISGHKTRSVFDRYNIVSTEDVRAAMQLTEASAAQARPPVSAKSVQKRQPKSRKALQAVLSKGAGA